MVGRSPQELAQKKEIKSMAKQFYIYEVKDNGTNQLGRQLSHWEVNQKATSKKEIMSAYNRKGYARRVKTVYTAEEFIKSFNLKEAKRILTDAMQCTIK